MDRSLAQQTQPAHAATLHAGSKATKVLAMLRNAFSSRTAAVWKPLYTTCVRPHLEFAVPAWCPYARGDINIIEKVQRRATELVHELRDLDYQSRCKHLQLEQLEDRRKRGDLI